MRTYTKKKFLFICHGATLAGATTSVFETLKRIDRSRYDIVVLLPSKGPLIDLLERENIKYRVVPLCIFYYCSPFKTFSAKNVALYVGSLRRLYKFLITAYGNIIYLPLILIEEAPDTVIINSSTLALAGFISKIMHRRVIWHVREVISTEGSWILKKMVAFIIRFSAEKVIVNSEFSLNDMSKLKIKNAVLVHNGVDLKRFNRRNLPVEEFKKVGLTPDDKIIGFVGHIYREKGWHNLVKASFLMTQEMPNVKFLSVGSGYMIERQDGAHTDPLRRYREDVLFKKVVENMRFDKNFIFLGQRFDMENIMPMMDCLVFPSIAPETFGRVIIEAMASGIPVVATDIGPSSEIVKDGITGLLAEPDNPKSISCALLDILKDKERAGRMGLAGRNRVEEMFDIEKAVPQFLKIYEG